MPPFEVAVATMVLVVDEPVQPNGNVHVYEVAPLTGATESVSVLPAPQAIGAPRIVTGVAGALPGPTASVCAVELPQTLLATTDRVPAFVPIDDIMESEVEVPVQPLGRVQVYDVAPLTGATEKVSGLPAVHPDVLLNTTPGIGGTVLAPRTDTDALELPQALLALTVTLPPADPAVVIRVSVVDVPVQPFGSVHV